MKHEIFLTSRKIRARLDLIAPLAHRRAEALPAFRYKALPDALTEPPLDEDVSDWEIVRHDSYWGAWRTNFLMRTTFRVPEGFDRSAPIVIHLPMGRAGDFFCHPESLAYLDGIAHASADRHHHELLLPGPMLDGEEHTLALHGWTGMNDYPTPDRSSTRLFMKTCAVVELDVSTRDFVTLARMALDIADHLTEHHSIRPRILDALDEAVRMLETHDPLPSKAFYESVPPALARLRERLAEAGPKQDIDILAIGHAHIDVAWLWQTDQTRRKVGRTFSNVLRLMEEYPDFKFTQSQPQLYAYTAEHYPEMFEAIKARVEEGRWELIGGTWIEPDCNATGAESLARQFLLGRAYFQKHFGAVDAPVLWLPDTFGYAWCLPQLIRQAGMDYFVTSKLSWNQYNRMPYQLFWWQGIDGTKVLSHFLTTPHHGDAHVPLASTYNATIDAAEVMETWERFNQKATYTELSLVYGYGDGGGGPTREMLDKIQHLETIPATPRVRTGHLGEYMARVESCVGHDLPTWNGEFYLELHRGTLTSQARTKRENRRCEVLLHDAEFLAAFAAELTGHAYPHAEMTKGWELVCLNQFHDILPGSSITAVYEDTAADYAEVRKLGDAAVRSALTSLEAAVPEGTAVVAVNPTTFTCERVGLLPRDWAPGLIDMRDRSPVAVQAVEDGTLIALPDLPAYGMLALAPGPEWVPRREVHVREGEDGRIVLEGPLLRVVIKDGELVSVFDREVEREVLPQGEVGNRLLAFEDRPLTWDAWDIDAFYEDKCEPIDDVVSVEIVERGPIRAAVRIVRRYRASTIAQTITLKRNSKRIDFKTVVDWHESHVLLKAAFPVDILAPTATFDIQWGNVERSTHRNTSWDWSRFESVAHKWADLSEGNYGVALLNDCKYGYEVHHNLIRLTLLKSATNPDPIADQGRHEMVYALLPHTGDWRETVPAEAYDLNAPVLVHKVEGAPEAAAETRQASRSLVYTGARNCVIETIKRAEDGRGTIVRLYEGERNRGPVTLHFGVPVARVFVTNLLEEDAEELSVENGAVRLMLKPYQIITLRLVPPG